MKYCDRCKRQKVYKYKIVKEMAEEILKFEENRQQLNGLMKSAGLL